MAAPGIRLNDGIAVFKTYPVVTSTPGTVRRIVVANRSAHSAPAAVSGQSPVSWCMVSMVRAATPRMMVPSSWRFDDRSALAAGLQLLVLVDIWSWLQRQGPDCRCPGDFRPARCVSAEGRSHPEPVGGERVQRSGVRGESLRTRCIARVDSQARTSATAAVGMRLSAHWCSKSVRSGLTRWLNCVFAAVSSAADRPEGHAAS